MGRTAEASHTGQRTPASGEFPSARALEPMPGGYLVAREAPPVRAWLRASGLSVWRVLALSPDALWLDAADVQGMQQAGSGELWLGNPAKKARMLSDAEIEALYYSAGHYVRMKDQYLAQS